MINIEDRIDNKTYSTGLVPKLIIVHHTGSAASDEAQINFLNNSNNVGCHFLTGNYGKIYQLADLDRITWHAGLSSWQNIEAKQNSLNWCAIGIEVNSDGYIFTEEQVEATLQLVCHLMRQYNIPADKVLRHANIAPTRKWDVGENFFKPKYGTWAEVQKQLHNMVSGNKISEWALEAAEVAVEEEICKDWSNPQQIIGTVKLAHILKNMKIIEIVSENGVSLEQFIAGLHKKNLLKKYE